MYLHVFTFFVQLRQKETTAVVEEELPSTTEDSPVMEDTNEPEAMEDAPVDETRTVEKHRYCPHLFNMFVWSF